MKNKFITTVAATTLAAAFAVSLVAAPSEGQRPGPPRGPDASDHNAQGPHAKGHHSKQRGGDAGTRLDRLIQRLDLTDDQVDAIRDERDKRADDIQALRDEIVDAQRKLQTLGKEMREAIASHLTDEQKAKMAARHEGKRDRGQRQGRGGDRSERRGGSHQGGPGHAPPADAP